MWFVAAVTRSMGMTGLAIELSRATVASPHYHEEWILVTR
jgi:hypothetical protein